MPPTTSAQTTTRSTPQGININDRQSTTSTSKFTTSIQTPATPKIPTSPTPIPRDDFNTNTTPTSFADSGFFSAPSPNLNNDQGRRPVHATEYRDWVLFPEGEDWICDGEGEVEGEGERRFLDTRGFDRDADLAARYHEVEEGMGMAASYERSTTQDMTTTTSLLNAVTHAFSAYDISTPSSHPYQPPHTPRFQDMELDEYEDGVEENDTSTSTSMLQIWTRKEERHERIAWWMERERGSCLGKGDLVLPGFGRSNDGELTVRKPGSVRGSERTRSGASLSGANKSAVRKSRKLERRGRGVRS